LIPRFRPPHSLRDFGAAFSAKRQGASVLSFEEKFAMLANQKFARVFPYGRTALVFVLEYLRDREHGKKLEVICPSYTCVVVAHAIVEAGCTPVFIDSNPDSLNMDWDYTLEAVSDRTLAVISTSLYGNPVEGGDLDRFHSEHPSVPIVQDCAHSFFADNVHQKGLVAIYGMNISKLMTTVFGGVASTDDKELADALAGFQADRLSVSNVLARIFRTLYFFGSLAAFSRPGYFLTNLLQRVGALGAFVNYYDPGKITFPKDAYRQVGVLELQLGIRQVASFWAEIARRRSIADVYREILGPVESLKILQYRPGSTYSHFVILSEEADFLQTELRAKGVELGRVIEYDVSALLPYEAAPYFGPGFSRQVSERVLNLPIHRGVDGARARAISKMVLRALSKGRQS